MAVKTPSVIMLMAAAVWLAAGSGAEAGGIAACNDPVYGNLLAKCNSTQGPCNNAVSPQVIQIGGPGSSSSNDEFDNECNDPGGSDPGTLDHGSPVAAIIQISLVDGDAVKIRVRNSDCVGSITAIFFNVPDGVTALSNLQVSAISGSVDTDWKSLLDPEDVHAPGFGKFDAVIYNGNNTPNGGDKDDIQAEEDFEFTFDLTGGPADLCGFNSELSVIPPGSPCNTLRTIVARYQGGPVEDESGVIGPCSPELAVRLADFSAEPGDRRVRIAWETQAEFDNAGFNVLRRDKVGGRTDVLNSGLIPARGNAFEGMRYEFSDDTAVNGVEYDYSLEDVDLSGRNMFHGPRRTVANPKSPSIDLTSPGYGEEVRGGLRMRFSTALNGRVDVQVSSDPTFRSRVVSVTTGASRRAEIVFGASDMRRIQELARDTDGILYWRVRVRDAADGSSASSTFRFRYVQ